MPQDSRPVCARPLVVACWRMTANGIGLEHVTAASRLEPATLAGDLERQAAQGVSEVVLEGDAELIAAAFEQRLVDRVVCWIEPTMALHPIAAVTAGIGAAHMDEAVRLTDLTFTVEPDGSVRVEARVAR